MINDHQSPVDKMLDTLNEKETYQQCIQGVLTELDKFLNGYSRNIMKFLIYGVNTYYLRKFNSLMTDVP